MWNRQTIDGGAGTYRSQGQAGKQWIVSEPNANSPMSADQLGKRVGELEGEVRALRASVSRLQTAGKTVIAQREEWKARALVSEQKVTDLTAQLANRRPTRDDRFQALRRLVARECIRPLQERRG